MGLLNGQGPARQSDKESAAEPEKPHFIARQHRSVDPAVRITGFVSTDVRIVTILVMAVTAAIKDAIALAALRPIG